MPLNEFASVESEKIRRRSLSTLLLLIACWIVFPLGPLSLILPFLLLFALRRAIADKAFFIIAVIILANPLTFFFARGAMEYFSGRPALHGMGLPGPEHANIDPETRCFSASGGCVISGDEWVHIFPHNLALRILTTVLGPPSDTYDGPYPTRAEAIAASTPGTLVSPEDFKSGNIPTDSGLVRLDPVLIEKIVSHLLPFSGYAKGELLVEEQLHAALFQKRCLILRWRGETPVDANEEMDEAIILIDIRNIKPFALYQIGGTSYFRRAAIAVFWR